MIQFNQRNLATSFTAVTFVVIAGTGIMMFFHILDAYTKKLHEMMGLFFVAVTLLHIYVNWSGMKNYFRKPLFQIAAGMIAAVSLGFIFTAETGENPKAYLIDSILNAPVEISFKVLGKDPQNVRQKLLEAGIKVESGATINEIAKANHRSPFEVVNILQK